jgi:2-methylcitrate dehydratase PrpD
MPADEPAARFNLALAVSLALVKGRAGLAEFSMQSTVDPRIQQLFEKVDFISDPSFESKTENFRGAELEIIFSDNTALKHKILLPKGEPENPATPDDLEEKFKSCIADFWTGQKTEAVMQAIRDLDQSDDIRMLTKLIRESEDVPT